MHNTVILVVVLPFFHSSGTSHVPDSQCVDAEISLQVMEGEALFWVQCKCFCDELIVKGAFLEMLHVFVISVPS